MQLSYQQRMQFVVDRVGGQTELARRVNLRYGSTLKPQNVQILTSSRGGRPARSSRYTPQFAAVAGVRAEWLATGRGPREAGTQGESSVRTVRMRLVTTGEDVNVDVTPEGLMVLREFMAMPTEDQKEILYAIRLRKLRSAAKLTPKAAPAVKLPRRPLRKPR